MSPTASNTRPSGGSKGRALHLLVLVMLAMPAISMRAQSPPAWRQVAHITSSTASDGEQLGFAVALSADGDTLAASAPMEGSHATGINGNENDDSAYSSGAVFVYARSGGGWTQQAYLKASNTGANDQFGNAIAISADGNTLAIAAVFEDSGATGINGNQADNSVEESGAVYVFTRTGTTWTQQAYIKASNTGGRDDGDTFGYAIALSDDGATLAVGAPSEDSSATGTNGNQADNSAVGAGAVYVFTRTGSTWSQQAYIKSANTRANSLFGYSVGLSSNGDTLAAGAFDEDGGKGAVHVLIRSTTQGTWTEQARLQASNAERADSFGASVSVSDDGNTVAAGALDEDSFLTNINGGDQGADDQSTDTSAGAAYVFTRSGNAWPQQAFIKASNTGKEDWFGVRLALSGDGNTLAVGAPNEDGDKDAAPEAGAAYEYSRSAGGWSHQAYLKGSTTDRFDELGSSIALSRDGRTMAVGARFDEPAGSTVSAGGVFIFAR
jgi:FG-GAP repeat